VAARVPNPPSGTGRIDLRLNRRLRAGRAFAPRSDARNTCVFVARLVVSLVLGVLVSGCVHVGVAITNAPTIPDCIPGSATKPCP